MFISLKPRSERKLSADEIIAQLQPKVARGPGRRVFMQVPPPIRIGGQLTKSLYQLSLQSPDTEELYRVAPEFARTVVHEHAQPPSRLDEALVGQLLVGL